MNQKHKQHGIAILPVLISAVVIGSALVAWAVSSRSSSSNTLSQVDKVVATALSDQGASIGTAWDQLVSIDGIDPTLVTFDTTATTGIYSAATGLSRQTPSNASLASNAAPDGVWTYKPAGFKGNQIGTSLDDRVLVLSGVKQSTCLAFNRIIYGATATIPASGLASTAFVNGSTALSPLADGAAADLSALAGVETWSSGCVSTTDSKNVIFYVLTNA